MGDVVSMTRPELKTSAAAAIDPELIVWAFREPERQAYRLGRLSEALAVMRAFNEPPEIVAAFEQGAMDSLRADAKTAADLRSKALAAGYKLSGGV